jgi:hypothetical protein
MLGAQKPDSASMPPAMGDMQKYFPQMYIFRFFCYLLKRNFQ